MSPLPPLTSLFDGTPDWADVTAAIGFALAAAYLVAALVGRLARRLFAALLGDIAVPGSAGSRAPLRLVKIVAFLLTAAALVVPALELAGVPIRRGLRADAFLDWVLVSGLRIVFVALGAFVVTRVVGLLVQRFEDELGRGAGLEGIERAKRARTLGALVRATAFSLVAAMAGLMILRELRVDIMPVLTGAGIVGLAVGFGAQSLVRDIIAGFFMILENQVRVGDVAVINGTGGLVEQINLRTIVLRDLEGAVHVFPNGAITTLTNRSRDFAYAVVDVGVAYEGDVDLVAGVIRDVGAAIREDPVFGGHILEPIEVLGIDAFEASQMRLRARIKTAPLKQWEVARELRRRIKKAFDARGIEIPYPRIVVAQAPPGPTA